MLFINACVRPESRTKKLADAVLEKAEGSVEELKLWEQDFPKVDSEFLKKRDSLIYAGQFDDPFLKLARQFADAEEILIAAPFWDLSFPASLKQYIELINVVGVTFVYTEEGMPKGLCKAMKLTFVTTAGGDFFPEEFGFGYIKSMAQNFYGINDVELVKVTGLDIIGNDAEKMISDKISEIRQS